MRSPSAVPASRTEANAGLRTGESGVPHRASSHRAAILGRVPDPMHFATFVYCMRPLSADVTI